MLISALTLRSLLRRTVDPQLREIGFSRSRNEWVRPAGPARQRIGAQMHSSRRIFTINVAIEFPAVYAAAGWRARGSAALTMAPHRLGELAGYPHDMWWSIRDVAHGMDVCDAIIDSAVPWLDEHSEIKAWSESLPDGWMKAAGMMALGDRQRAADVLSGIDALIESETDEHRRWGLERERLLTSDIVHGAASPPA